MSIIANMSAAAEVMLGREEAMDRLDVSADGFYASFKGLALVGVIDGVSLFVTHATRVQLEETTIADPIRFTLVTLFVAFCAYAASMLALYLLCRTEETQKRFSAAVVLHNWASPVVSAVFVVPFIVMLTMVAQSHPNPASSAASMILFASIVLLVLIGVRLLRVSLAIPAATAFTFFAVTAAVSLVIEHWLGNLLGL